MTCDPTTGGASLVEDRQRPPQQRAVTDERRHDFFITQNVVVDEYLPLIGPYGFTVYGYLVRLSSKEGEAYPSVKRIAAACGMSESGVRTALSKLSEHALIRVTERINDLGDRDTNLYAVLHLDRKSKQGVVVSAEGGGPFNGGGVVRSTEDHGTKTEITKTLPPTPQGEASVGNGHSRRQQRAWPDADPEPDRWQRCYREALWEYFGRDARDYEIEELFGNLTRYGQEKLCPSPETFRDLALTCRRDTKEASGKWPKTLKPLLDLLAEVTGDLRDRRNGCAA